MPLNPEEQEARLREAENELTEYRVKIEGMSKDIKDIRQYIKEVSEASARLDHLDKLEGSIAAAHKRLDIYKEDLLRLQLEHGTCQKSKDTNSATLEAIRSDLSQLRSKVDTVVRDNSKLEEAEAKNKGFWKDRFTKLLDAAIPIIIGFLIAGFVHLKNAERDEEIGAQMKAVQVENNKLKSELESRKSPTDLRQTLPLTTK